MERFELEFQKLTKGRLILFRKWDIFCQVVHLVGTAKASSKRKRRVRRDQEEGTAKKRVGKSR